MPDSKTVIALFNYGGGMRGLIPAHFMARIEEVTGLRMADMVDIFCGPSTGAILNASLTLPHPDNPEIPKWRARQLVQFYEREGIRIFPPDRFRDFRALIHDFNNRTMRIGKLKSLFRHGHYDPGHLGYSLRGLFGDAKLADSLKSLIIPVYNLDGDYLKVMKEEDETDDAPVRTQNNLVDSGGHSVWLKNMKIGKPHPTPDVSLYDAVLASCAAPTYFPCHHFKATQPGFGNPTEYSGIDGSIFDNPCISYHGAIRHHLPPDTRLIMIILGTGRTLRSFRKEDWNRYGGLGIVDPANDLPLINILFHASETALVESFSEEMGDDVFVFNKSMLEDEDDHNAPSSRIDDASPQNLKNLYYFFEEVLEENKAKFDKVCDILVQNKDKNKNRKENALKKFRWPRPFKTVDGA
ncbi:MAG: patatin-like phospholipase family protein [Alphaproteobacteria bacterium]|nr:patatin-like phospholipase family protein [Alphaproteobacteria bacterium]